jgi:excinuclease UvrABC nuclease subunit
MSLSERIRANSEAAPWVIEEVVKMDAENERLHRLLYIQDSALVAATDVISALQQENKLLRDIYETAGIVCDDIQKLLEHFSSVRREMG